MLLGLEAFDIHREENWTELKVWIYDVEESSWWDEEPIEEIKLGFNAIEVMSEDRVSKILVHDSNLIDNSRFDPNTMIVIDVESNILKPIEM